MNINRSTKNWAEGQTSALKSERPTDLDATRFKEVYGDQKLGDVANKLADPNYVDPAKMRKVGGDKLDKDAFMKLMLTQMQHQDPSNPLKSHEMAAQMAQFTSLEQLSNINKTLENMALTQNAGSPMESLGLIGKVVQGDSSRFTRVAGEKSHELAFKLPDAATKIKIEVKNPEGKTVKEFSLANLKAGDNRISWNGISDEGLETRPGDYSFTIHAEKSNGKKMVVDTAFEGQISGVKFVSGQPVLMIGDKTIKLNEVQEIKMPTQKTATSSFMPMSSAGVASAAMGSSGAATAANDSSSMASATHDVTPKDQIKEATGKEPEPTENNLGDFAMSQNLINKLNKQLGEENGGQVKF